MSLFAPENAISELSDIITSRMGMHFPRKRWEELGKKITAAAGPLGFADAASCVQWMLSSRTGTRPLELLASWLTVGETFFFREHESLHALSERAFPEIMRAHAHDRRVRIWSAGCSTGEEPYTVAMIVADYPGFHGWDVSILGTDINRTFLDKAEAGAYTEWSFRGVAPAIRKRFFQKGAGATSAILPSLRKMVTFAHLNLVDDVYPALFNNTNAMDLILCRNVLMYFTPDFVRKVIRKLQRSLLPGGWLLVSPVEAPLVPGPVFLSTPDMRCLQQLKEVKTLVRTAPPPGPAGPVTSRLAPVTGRPEPAATFDRARDLYAHGDYPGSIEILKVLASRPGAAAPVLQLLSRACANRGMLTEAGNWCMRTIAADPLSAASRYLLAMIRIETQEPEEAMSALRKAIYLEPDFVLAHITLANLCRRRNPGASERHLRIALQVLQGCRPEEEMPESEGMTAGALVEMITATRSDGRGNGQRRKDQ